MDGSGPVEITGAKGLFPPDPLWNTATEFSFEAVYDNGVRMVVSNQERMGVTWEGTEGNVWASRRKYEVDPASIDEAEFGEDAVRLYRSDDHYRNFIDCVISRGPTAAPIETAHRSITVCHLGNIAMRLGRDSLRWDPSAEQILGDQEAAAMLDRAYRSPWKLA